MLPHPSLKPVYDDIVWLYIYRDFSGSPADRAAERVEIRFGVTSYPQHFIVHPSSLETLANTGRSIQSFLGAVSLCHVRRSRSLRAHAKLVRAESRAIALEERPTEKLANEGLQIDDIVVRTRSLEYLVSERPDRIAALATELLAVPNDFFRMKVCDVLRTHGDSSAAAALESLVRDPSGSINPNRLRCEAVRALARCGRPKSLSVLREPAVSRDFLNSLTTLAIETLGEIGARHPEVMEEAVSILCDAYPPPLDDAQLRRHERAATFHRSLATRVHQVLMTLTGRQIPFPGEYDENAVARLRRAWSS